MDDEEEEEEEEKEGERRRNNGKESGIDFFASWMKITQGKGIFGSVCQMYAALCLCVSR